MMHTVNSVAAAMPYLEKSKSASIVIISSVSGFEVDFAAGSYGAFKAALIHYAKGLSNQLIAKGIRVNSVSPGNTYFDGGIWQNIENGMPDLYKMAMSLNPTGRMGTPQEVAAGVVFLASPVASRISGTNLIIDGALTKAAPGFSGYDRARGRSGGGRAYIDDRLCRSRHGVERRYHLVLGERAC